METNDIILNEYKRLKENVEKAEDQLSKFCDLHMDKDTNSINVNQLHPEELFKLKEYHERTILEKFKFNIFYMTVQRYQEKPSHYFYELPTHDRIQEIPCDYIIIDDTNHFQEYQIQVGEKKVSCPNMTISPNLYSAIYRKSLQEQLHQLSSENVQNDKQKLKKYAK